MKNKLLFRNLKEKDIISVLEIYNFHINNGLANFEEDSVSLEKFKVKCNEIIKSNLPFIVCEKNNIIIGFAFLNKFRNKSGYKFSFENSIYIHENYRGIGIGNMLLKELLVIVKDNKYIKTIIAVIGNYDSEASIKIHQNNGFKIIGTLKKVGFKKNKWIDAIYMQKILNEKD